MVTLFSFFFFLKIRIQLHENLLVYNIDCNKPEINN